MINIKYLNTEVLECVFGSVLIIITDTMNLIVIITKAIKISNIIISYSYLNASIGSSLDAL